MQMYKMGSSDLNWSSEREFVPWKVFGEVYGQDKKFWKYGKNAFLQKLKILHLCLLVPDVCKYCGAPQTLAKPFFGI